MVGDPGTQASRTQRAPQAKVIPRLKLHHSQASNLNTGIARTGEYQRICSGLRLNDHSHHCPILDWRTSICKSHAEYRCPQTGDFDEKLRLEKR
jgi:hypothetical protein